MSDVICEHGQQSRACPKCLAPAAPVPRIDQRQIDVATERLTSAVRGVLALLPHPPPAAGVAIDAVRIVERAAGRKGVRVRFEFIYKRSRRHE